MPDVRVEYQALADMAKAIDNAAKHLDGTTIPTVKNVLNTMQNGGLEGKAAEDLRNRMKLSRKRLAGVHCEGARPGDLAGHMRRNREAVADADDPGLREDAVVIRGEPDHPGHINPGEAGTGELTGPVYRVAMPEAVLIEPVLPARRIIVESNGRR